jgi:ATP-dependent Lon protease
MARDFVSVIHPGAPKKPESEGSGKSYPVLPVRDTVLFPHAVLPLTVGRESSIQLIQSLGEDKTILVVAQRDARQDAPEGSDLHIVGTRATVHKVVKMPNQSLFVFTEGTERVKLGQFTQDEPFLTAESEVLEEIQPEKSPEFEALQRNVLGQFQEIVASSSTLSDDLQTIALNIEEPSRLADFIASSLPFLSTADKQALLEMGDVKGRLEAINSHLAKELEVQQLRNKIQSEVQDSVQQSQRDFYLNEQMKAIQKELGEVDETQKDVQELKEKIEAAGMPDEVKKEALKELSRLSRMNPAAADYSLTRNYVGQVVGGRGRHPEGEGDPGHRPLWAEEGEGAHPRLLERTAVEAGHEGADPMLRRTSGRGQDVAGAVDREGAGTEVLAHLLGRHA